MSDVLIAMMKPEIMLHHQTEEAMMIPAPTNERGNRVCKIGCERLLWIRDHYETTTDCHDGGPYPHREFVLASWYESCEGHNPIPRPVWVACPFCGTLVGLEYGQPVVSA